MPDNRTTQYHNLKFGDIIQTEIPFEETTPEYYNGYGEYEVRGELFMINGQRSKIRPVMVVAVHDDELIYANITSSRGCLRDVTSQYKVQDNSMTPNADKCKTYVELTNIRKKVINPESDVRYFTSFNQRDLDNIRGLLVDSAIKTEQKDRYAYVGNEYVESLQNALVRNNFKRIDDDTYNRDAYTITFKSNGVIYHHFERSLDEVRMLVEEYEGIKLKTLDDITELDTLYNLDTLLNKYNGNVSERR